MGVWFTADQHYLHANVLLHCRRPFASPGHMLDGLIDRHNALVSPGDSVYELGDFSFDHRRIAEILSRLNGVHHLIVGNHDKCHPCHAKHRGFVEKYLGYGFASVTERATIWLREPGREAKVLLCHMPYAASDSEDEARRPSYNRFRPSDEGLWLLHGHSHNPPAKRLRRRMLDVGVDAWGYAPVSAKAVLDLIEMEDRPPVPDLW